MLQCLYGDADLRKLRKEVSSEGQLHRDRMELRHLSEAGEKGLPCQANPGGYFDGSYRVRIGYR